MHTRTLISIILGVLLIALLLWLGAYAYQNIDLTPADTVPSSAVSSLALRVGEQAAVDGFTLKLLQITGDNRCPRGAVCIWAGEVTVAVELATSAGRQMTELSSIGPAYVFNGYEIAMLGVGPIRTSTRPEQEDYRITFAVREL
jgi:hypothetical protein